LWDDKGDFGNCVRDEVDEEDIRSMLREGPLQFVEVNVGWPLRWIPQSDRFKFWKSLQKNLWVLEKPYIEDYPESFYYCASEWTGRDDARIIVLFKWH
jgi:hypothetical protein